MTKAAPSPVDALLARKDWHEERKELRRILLGRGLTEEVKWGKLCYSLDGGNVALIFALKTYCAVGFLKGALLDDPEALLVSPGAHSQAMRQMRFTGIDQIKQRRPLLERLIDDAIRIEREGKTIDFTQKADLPLPEELRAAFADDPAYAEAFARLTPGRRRGYLIHFSDAKKPETRRDRIARFRDKIMDGLGMQDR